MSARFPVRKPVLPRATVEAILASGTLKATFTCPTCAGTGWDTTSFYRTCSQCGASWDDVDGKRDGSKAMEAWEHDPSSDTKQPCGHDWLYHIERDRFPCSECEGEGQQAVHLTITQLTDLLMEEMTRRTRLEAKSSLDNARTM